MLHEYKIRNMTVNFLKFDRYIIMTVNMIVMTDIFEKYA